MSGGYLKRGFLSKILYACPHHSTCMYSIFKSHFTVLTTSGDLYDSRYSLLWNILNRSLPSPSFFFGPNIFLNTFSSDIYSCWSSVKTVWPCFILTKNCCLNYGFLYLIFRILNIRINGNSFNHNTITSYKSCRY